jgi:2-phosphosulfolactate phosphatase
MPRTIRVHFLPETVAAVDLRDRTAVVIDLLRATTTICHALAAGARDVLACLSVDDARRAVNETNVSSPADCILGGERGGVKIAGFDLGNSPAEYTPASVAGRRVVFTTTNGTRAILQCRGAKRILLASLANRAALCHAIADDANVDIVCAGTDGHVTAEDVLTAGAIVDPLQPREFTLDDQAQLALYAWQSINESADRSARLRAALRASRGGVNLVALGYDRDIEIAAAVDTLGVVPEVVLPSEGAAGGADKPWATIRAS